MSPFAVPLVRNVLNLDLEPDAEDCIIEAGEAFYKEHADNLWLVLEGDWGGQIYLTIPIALLKKFDTNTIRKIGWLHQAIDREQWKSNDDDGRAAQIVFSTNPDKGVAGGMGGGKLLKGKVWFHPDLDAAKWAPSIRDICAE
jgi:hypothetical protein